MTHDILATRIAGVKTVQNKTTTLFTVADVAAALAVSRATVYEMIWSGEIHAVRVRGSWRISKPDLMDYANGIGAWWLLKTCPSTADTGATRDGATCHSQPAPSQDPPTPTREHRPARG
ncbi:MAG: helix-turn-helix domain-containing protein [Methanoculleus sp.]|nr:helix-turn-helix domain-containing protein [Methanoculleus sp.]